MAAGSVRLPELKQKITVDTSDLTRAQAAARRFKQDMERNLKVDSGKLGGDGLDGLNDKLDRVAESTRKLREENEEHTKSLRELNKVQRDYATSLRDVDERTKRLSDHTRTLRDNNEKAGRALRNNQTDLKNLTTQADVSSKSFDDLRRSMRNVGESDMGDFRKNIQDTTMDVRQLRNAVDDLRRSDTDLNNVFSKFGQGDNNGVRKMIDDLKELQAELGKSFDIDTSNFDQKLSNSRDRLRDLRAEAEKFGESSEKINQALGRNTEDTDRDREANEQLAQALEKLDERFDRLGDAIEKSRGSVGRYNVSIRDSLGQQERQFLAVERAQDRAAKAREELAKATGELQTSDLRLAAIEHELAAFSAEIEKANARTETAERRLAGARTEVADITDQIAEREQNLERLRSASAEITQRSGEKDRQLTELRRRLAEATQDETSTEEQLNRIRQQITQGEEDLQRISASGAQVRKRMAEEERSLNAMRTGLISSTEKIAERERELNTVRTENNKVAEEANRLLAKGSEEETRYATAKERSASAADKSSRAERDLATAGRDVSSSHETASNSLRKHSAATEDASNKSRGLYQVLRNLKMAFVGLGVVGAIVPAIGVLGGAVVGLAAAASNLLPSLLLLPAALTGVGVAAAGMFAIFKNNKGLEKPIQDLKKAFSGIQEDLQNRVNPSVIAVINSLKGLAPAVKAQVPAFADAFNRIAQSFAKYLGSDGFMNDFKKILAGGIQQFENLGMAGRAAFESFIRLAAMGQDRMIAMTAKIRELAEDFRDYLNTAAGQQRINKMWDTAKATLDSLISIVKNLAGAFGNLFDSADMTGFTKTVLDTLNNISADFKRFTSENRAEIDAMFKNLSTQVALLRPLFASVADGIRIILTNIDLTPLVQSVQELMTNFAQGAAEAANAIGRMVHAAVPALNSILELIRGLIPSIERIGTTIIQAVTPAIQSIKQPLIDFGRRLADIVQRVGPIVQTFLSNMAKIGQTVLAVLGPILTFLSQMIAPLGSLTGGFGLLLTSIVALKIGASIFGGLGRAITGAAQPTTRLQTVMAGLTSPIRSVSSGIKEVSNVMADNKARAAALGEGYSRTASLGDALRGSSNTLLSTLGNMGASFTRGMQSGKQFGDSLAMVDGQTGRFTNTVGRVSGVVNGSLRAAFTGMKSAAQGAIGVLGNLGGILGGAVLAGLTALISKSAEAKASTDAFAQSLQASKGALNENSNQMLTQKLAAEGVFDATSKLGISEKDVVAAIEAGGSARENLIAQLKSQSGETGTAAAGWTNLTNVFGYNTDSATGAANTISNLGGELDKGSDHARQMASATSTLNQAMTPAQQQAKTVADGFKKMADASRDGSSGIDGLSTALDAISGHGASAEKASADLTKAIDSLKQEAPQAGESIKILGGQLDTTTTAGANFASEAADVRQKMLESAQAAAQHAGGLNNLQAAQAAANGEIQRGRQALIDTAVRFGATRDEATKYADSLTAIPPEVLTKILADPAAAQKTYEDFRAGVTNPAGGPPKTPMALNAQPAQTGFDQFRGTVLNPAGGPPKLPMGLNPAQAQQQQQQVQGNITAPPGGPPKLPMALDPSQAQQQQQQVQNNITAPQGGAPELPISAVTQLAQQIVQQLVQAINTNQGAKLPVSATIDQGGGAKQIVDQFVTYVTGLATAIIPVNANTQTAQTAVDQFATTASARKDVIVPITGNVDQLNQIYSQANQFIRSTIIIAPITGNIDQLNQVYHQANDFITKTVIIAPVTADVSQAVTQYQALAQMITQPLQIPVSISFGGLGGLFGALGGIVENETGNIIERSSRKAVRNMQMFADGGMQKRDHATLKAAMGDNLKFYDKGGTPDFKSMGLTPMPANQAAIVPPNTWRVVGDRPQGDEAFIPINNSPRSEALLNETAKRMGYALQKYAQGAVSTTSTQPARGDDRSSRAGMQADNQQAAPLIGGDLNVVVPQDTPVQDAFTDVNFELRRIKQGGVHTRSRVRGVG